MERIKKSLEHINNADSFIKSDALVYMFKTRARVNRIEWDHGRYSQRIGIFPTFSERCKFSAPFFRSHFADSV